MEDNKQQASAPAGPQVANSFDADGYFKDQGMSLNKVNDDGTADVSFEDGSKGKFDPRALVKKLGYEPGKNFDVTFNAPETALNESPVGLIDRLKMSVGNTKGSVAYLKKNFKDATVDEQGNLVVKDKGAWKRVDLDGISGDDGWKASEILGDIADVGGDALVGVGSMIGATIGAAAGAPAGGVGAVPGAIAGSGVGAGVASGIKNVLGRVAGTSDTTPEEFVKDVMFDTALGLVGEVVPLGAKKLLGPTLARGFSKLASVGEATQDMLAKGMAALSPEEGYGSFRSLFQRGEEVVPNLAEKVGRADAAANSRGANAAVGAASETPQMALSRILYEDTVKAAEPLVENIQGTKSLYYEREAQNIIKETFDKTSLKDASMAAKQYGHEAENQLEQLFSSQGLLETTTEKTASVTKTSESAVSREMQSNTRTASKTVGEATSTNADGVATTRPIDTSRNVANDTARRGQTSTATSSTQSTTTRSVVAQKVITPKALAEWAAKKGGNEFATESSMKELAAGLNAMREHVSNMAQKGFENPKDVIELMKSGKQLHALLDHLPADKADLFEKSEFGKFMKNFDMAVEKMLPKGTQPRFNTLTSNYRILSADMRKLAGGLDVARSADNFRDVAGSLVEHFRTAQFLKEDLKTATSRNILNSLKILNPDAGKHFAKLELENTTRMFGGGSIAPALSGAGLYARGAAFIGKKAVMPAAMSVSKMQRRASLKAFLSSAPGRQFMGATRALKAGGRTIAAKPELVAAGLTTALTALRQR